MSRAQANLLEVRGNLVAEAQNVPIFDIKKSPLHGGKISQHKDRVIGETHNKYVYIN